MKVCPNTSPLLVLARIERLDLLGDPASVVLTSAVLDEVRDKLDAATERVNDLALLATVVEPMVTERVDLLRSLGPREKSVLAWAVSAGADAVCVFDDAAARVEARRLGLVVIGTLGLVLRAKVDGRLTEAVPLIERAVIAGLYLDDAVLSGALASIGERWPP